ncbi:hypothetical protein [Catenulispora subtropica]|uniref:Lipoprotein n=1 Tax=Catenulispora subtropica TaxID=450798 RepID=A0ABP5E9B6_9ACTN
MALMFGAAACSSSASKPAADGSSSPTGASSPSTGSAPSSATGSGGTPATGSGGTSAPGTGTPTTPVPSSGPVQRVAEIHSEGGFAGNALRLQPPAVVVYSDGTVVLNASKRYTLDSGALASLLASVRKDLDGLPETVSPTKGRPIPDIPTTVLGIRKGDGSYQTVRAAGLPQIGKDGGYPAPLYDAYTKLNDLNATAGTPFTGPDVRYLLSCPAAGGTKPEPWPAGMPQPVNAEGATCVEIHVATGPAAAAVRTACQAYLPGDLQSKPAVPYQSDKGVRTCQWRYALPDETS